MTQVGKIIKPDSWLRRERAGRKGCESGTSLSELKVTADRGFFEQNHLEMSSSCLKHEKVRSSWGKTVSTLIISVYKDQ